jgi:cellulose synthase/poly-beta-1,6-N-acetylglucosamine synthase-like glycosyltransferase
MAYPAILWIARWKFTRPIKTAPGRRPSLSVIIAAHNEEEGIGAKLEDCLSWAYPGELVEIIVASDGSTDSSEKIVEEYAARAPRIQLLRVNRGGKSWAQNRAAEKATGEILFFTDVNTRTRPELLELIVRNFQDPEVGMVSGTVHFVQPDGAVSSGQGIYWRYELFLREAESALGLLATGSGQALALRRGLFRQMHAFYGDDCILPLDVRLQGSRVVQDRQAIVFDTMPYSVEGELQARMRMTARNWTGTLSRFQILNPFRFPLTALALISHKFLRWLTPFFLLCAFFASAILIDKPHFLLIWILQMIFYMAALMGWIRTRRSREAGFFAYPFSFCLANLGFFLGLVMAARNERITTYRSSS